MAENWVETMLKRAKERGYCPPGDAQAKAPASKRIPPEAFDKMDGTVLYWLSSAGIMVNSRGTVIMIDPTIMTNADDPTLSEDGSPMLVDLPIEPKDVPRVDAVLYTHADSDHVGERAPGELAKLRPAFYGTARVKNKICGELGVPEELFNVKAAGESIQLGDIRITLTPGEHDWQTENGLPDPYGPLDCVGFYIETPDGNIWAPGDTRLLPEHLTMAGKVDVMFADFSDDNAHFGRDGSLKIVNTIKEADLIMYHYGTVKSDLPCFTADPKDVIDLIEEPSRLKLLAPGEPYILNKKVK